jgi:hypothetical protein
VTTKPGSSMPPVKPQPAPGTQTSDRYGNVVSTRPAPQPETPPSSGTKAPTSDRYGHVIDGFTK